MLTEQRSPLLGDFQAAGFPFSIQAPRTLRPGASGALLVLGGLLGVVSLVLGGIGGIGSLLLGGIGRIPGLFGGVGGGVLGLGGGIGSGILQIAGLLGGASFKSAAFSAAASFRSPALSAKSWAPSWNASLMSSPASFILSMKLMVNLPSSGLARVSTIPCRSRRRLAMSPSDDDPLTTR